MNLASALRIPTMARRAAPAPAPVLQQTASEAMRGRWGRWDSKVSDRMNQAHWAKVTGLPINAELAYANNWLRAQAEYEISSNPVIEGMLNTFKTDVIGPEGPHYRVTSSDSKYNRRRETIWRRWARHAGANRQLSLVEILSSGVGSLWKAGEFGWQMVNDPAAPGPVKMRVLPVHMHRLMTPPEMLGDPDVALGVRRDANRNPVQYYISEPYIFGPFEVYTGEFYRVKYEDFIHGYRLDEEDQVRGVPWLASSLDTVGQLRDWDKAMLDAAEMMAKTGVLWQLKNPDSAAPVQVQPGTSTPMQRGQHTFGPPGYEAEQLAPTQPSSDQQSWRAEKKAEIGRGVNMPAMILNLDSSKHSYSSARFDNQPYWRFVATVQNWLGRIALDRMECVVVREAELAGELEEEPEDCEHSWGWIKPPQVDPTKESQSERFYLQNQTQSWSDAVIAHGEDPDRVFETLKRDHDRLAEAGLPTIPGIPDPSKAAGAGAQGPGTGGRGPGPGSGSRETSVGREGVRSSGHPSGHVHEAAEDESASAKKPVNDQEARGDAAQTFPGPVEIDGQRSREGPGHPFRGNQHTGGIPGAHMAPDAGGGSGGGSHADYLQPLTSRGQGPITSKEVRRDYTKKSESLPKYLKRFGENFARRLAALGLPIHNIQVSDDGHSAYLHRKEKDFEVRITDHDPKRGTQPERPTIRYPFYLKGSTPRAKDLTDLLVKIASRHAP